jgi:hypothetical protein
MSNPILPPYVAPYKPLPQVTPFTYRDGTTMLKKLDGMGRYINRVLIPFVNDNYTALGDQFEEQVNILIEEVNNAISEIAGVEVQDPVVADIFNDTASQTRGVTDVLYAAKSVVDDLVTLTSTGRLSTTALNAAYAAKTDVDNLLALTSIGRLSQASLNATFAAKRWFDVKSYGAVGDAVTDDTAAVQAAIAAAQPVRGTVYFPAGIYIVNATLTIYSNVWWVGEGPGASEIRLKNGANVDLVKTTQYDTYAGGSTQNGPDRWGIDRLRLNGNGANQTATSWTLKSYARCFTISNSEIINGRDGNFHSEWGTGGTEMESKIINVNVNGAINGPGIDWQGPHDSSFANVYVFKNGEASQAWDGIKTSGNAGGEIFVNTHVWGAHLNGFNIRKMATVTGCVAEGAKNYNVIIAYQRTMFDGHVYGRSDGSSGTEVGIAIGDATSGPITGYHVNAMLFNFNNAASIPVQFISDSGGTVLATVSRGSATVTIQGTVNPRTHLMISTVDADAGLAYMTATTMDHPSAPLTTKVSGANRFRINGAVAQFANGIGLRGYSDDLTTEKWRIDSAIGFMRPGVYTTATLPSAATVGAGAMVYNTTDSSICVSTGSAWLRADGTAV